MLRTLSVSVVKSSVTRRILTDRAAVHRYEHLCIAREEAIDNTVFDASPAAIRARDSACAAVMAFVAAMIPRLVHTEWGRVHLPYELANAHMWARHYEVINDPDTRRIMRSSCENVSRLCAEYDIKSSDPETDSDSERV